MLSRKDKDAIEQFVKALELDPKQIKYYYALGSEFARLKEYSKGCCI